MFVTKGRKVLELSSSLRAWDEAGNTMEDAANLYDFNSRFNNNVKTL